MAPRPNWKGYLKLSLVSCAVALYPATTTSERIRFNIINRKTGNRIRNDTIEIEQFVPMAEVDRIYLDESFYLVPQDEISQEAFAVIREAMRKENLVGLARVVIYRREHLLLLAQRGKGLVATALRYKAEVRNETNYFDDIEIIKVPADMLKLAVQIIESKKGHFDPSKFEDRCENALMALIKAKRAGKAPPVLSEERPSNVINLMDALRRSARGDRRRRATSRRKSGTRAKRAPSRKKVRRAS
jgi:DNA end-binding protein Ku